MSSKHNHVIIIFNYLGKVRNGVVMPTVSVVIAFEAGFSNDNVIGQINNREIFQRKGLTTNPMLGYAGSVKVNIDESAKAMEIVIPNKGIRDTIPLKLQEITNIAIRLEGKKITPRYSEEPLGYL